MATIKEKLSEHIPNKEAYMEGYAGRAGISGALSQSSSIHSAQASFLPSTPVTVAPLEATVVGEKDWELINLDPEEIQAS